MSEQHARRILHINDDLEVGGIQRLIVIYAEELNLRFTTVGVLARRGGLLWSELPEATVQYQLPPRRGVLGVLRYGFHIRRHVKRDRWDVVHAHQRGLTLVSRIALIGTGVKVAEHVHNTFLPSGAKKFLSFHGHHVVACGSAGKEMIVQDFGRPAKRVSVVRNTVRDPGRSLASQPPSVTGSPPRIIGIGRAVEEKDPLRFLRVVRILQERFPGLSAEWVGAGPLLEEMRAYVGAHQMVGVALEGESTKVVEKLRGADLLLLTSRQEGLPLTVLESIASGRAVVCSDVGSCRDLVVEGSTGFLFPPSLDDEAVAGLLEAYLTSGRYVADGRSARVFYEDHCSVELMIDTMMDVYNSLC